MKKIKFLATSLCIISTIIACTPNSIEEELQSSNSTTNETIINTGQGDPNEDDETSNNYNDGDQDSDTGNDRD